MTTTKLSYIEIDNKFLSEGNQYHLTATELYIYSLIKISTDLEGNIILSPAAIAEKSPVLLGSTDSRAYSIVKKVLLSLKEKNIIRFTDMNGELVKEIDNKKSLKIVLTDTFTKKDDGKKINFTQLYFSAFRKFNDVNDFYIYLAIYRFNQAGAFICSYHRWADILQTSKKTAIELIKKAEKNGFIDREIGKYINDNPEEKKQKRQEINKYTIATNNTKLTNEPIKPQIKQAEEPKVKQVEQEPAPQPIEPQPIEPEAEEEEFQEYDNKPRLWGFGRLEDLSTTPPPPKKVEKPIVIEPKIEQEAIRKQLDKLDEAEESEEVVTLEELFDKQPKQITTTLRETPSFAKSPILRTFAKRDFEKALHNFTTQTDDMGFPLFPTEQDLIICHELHKQSKILVLSKFENQIYQAGKERLLDMKNNHKSTYDSTNERAKEYYAKLQK